MSCSREEIERKRLAALERRRSKLEPPAPEPAPARLGKAPAKSYAHNSPHHSTHHPYCKPEVERAPLGGKVVSGSLYLISENRFEVCPSEFSAPLIDIFKSLPSKNYGLAHIGKTSIIKYDFSHGKGELISKDGKSRLWNFSIDDYQDLMSKVAPLSPHIVLGPIPSYVLRILTESPVNPDTIDLSPIEPTLRNQLMPFQQEGVRFGIVKNGRCMIADDMGLGKTFQALAIANYYKQNWPLLIVTTSSMRDTWQTKIHELLPSVPMMNIVTLTSSRDTEIVSDQQTEVVIVSYKITTMHTQLLKSKKFGVVIIDESHYLKSHKAQCTVALTAITKPAARVVLLSGTPALSRPNELYTQLSIIEPKLFSNFTEYGKRYCAGKLGNFGWDMSGQSNLAELQVVLHKRFLIRRTKEQVLTTLQDKIRESVILDPALMPITEQDQQGLSQMAQSLIKAPSSKKQAELLKFFGESARVKVPAICKYITQMLKTEPGKFLVFAHHKVVVDAVCLTLDELGVHYVCIVGSTKTDIRSALVEKFQYSESCRCAVLSITAANSGITLTAAQLVLFAELHWNPGILTQAEARAHRIGQQNGVRVRYLLAKGTSDDHIWPMLQDKLNVLNQVGLSKDSFEDTTCMLQERNNSIIPYLSSPSCYKNKDNYIPGTNIRKKSISAPQCSNSRLQEVENIDRSFLEDDEGDALLANIDV